MVTVSIVVITYNHELYIKQTIESILMQKVSFSIEVIIGEDYSKDSTRRICEGLIEGRTEKITLLPSSRNLGALPNLIKAINSCNGKYIALCEGDDYWTDPLKLQKQVDFLEKNLSYSLCFHNAEVKFENSNKPSQLFNKSFLKNSFNLIDAIELKTWYVPTPSIMIRREMLEFPTWLNYVQQGDKALQLILATKGDFHYIDEVMCVYRKHPTSIGAQTPETLTKVRQIQMYSYFNVYTNFIYNGSVNTKIDHFRNELEKSIMIEKQIKLKTILFNFYIHYIRKFLKFY
jgi:glycosyltransferase involved in cell wall biosynthesis